MRRKEGRLNGKGFERFSLCPVRVQDSREEERERGRKGGETEGEGKGEQEVRRQYVIKERETKEESSF